MGNGKLGNRKIRQPFFGGVGKVGNGKMGNGKLGSGNPGSFANSIVILLFIWNVDMQLLYIKLSAVIYATLLNCQLVAVFSVSAVTQIRHYCIEPTLY